MTSLPNLMMTSSGQFPLSILIVPENICNMTAAPLEDEGHSPHAIKTVLNVYIVGTFCLFGFFGNAVSIIVLNYDKEAKNTTAWLLQSLSVVDITYLMACVFIQILKTVSDNRWSAKISRSFPAAEPFIWPIASVAQTTTVWTVMLVTIDRYIAICKPFDIRLRTVPRAKISFLVVVLMSVAYNLPLFFELSAVTAVDFCTGETHAQTIKTPLRKNTVYFLVYKTVCYFIFRTIGPLATLIFLNRKLINALKTVNRKYRAIKRNVSRRENYTFMVVVIVSVFIVCETPDAFLRVAILAGDLNPKILRMDPEKAGVANAFANALLTFNSSVNFLVYCLLGKKFRFTLGKLVSCNSHAGLAHRCPHPRQPLPVHLQGQQQQKQQQPMTRTSQSEMYQFVSPNIVPRIPVQESIAYV